MYNILCFTLAFYGLTEPQSEMSTNIIFKYNTQWLTMMSTQKWWWTFNLCKAKQQKFTFHKNEWFTSPLIFVSILFFVFLYNTCAVLSFAGVKLPDVLKNCLKKQKGDYSASRDIWSSRVNQTKAGFLRWKLGYLDESWWLRRKLGDLDKSWIT